jgi:hypothetical protein
VAAVHHFVVEGRCSRVWKEHLVSWVLANVAMTRFGSAHNGTRFAASLGAEAGRRSTAGRAERLTSREREYLL